MHKTAWLTGKVNLIVALAIATSNVYAQSQVGAETIERRIARARALAAAHNLQAAATELDSIRNLTTDDAVRDVARIMLMGILLEEGAYARAEALLEEGYKARSAQNEASVRSYFALAGQTINGVRTHLERYQKFGINLLGSDLPAEAVSDLDRLRSLLERVAAQAREMSGDNAKSVDAAALLEDVASVRGTLARDEEDKLRWQREVANARQTLTASQTRAANHAAAPRSSGSSSSPAPVANTTAAGTTSSTSNATVNPPTASPSPASTVAAVKQPIVSSDSGNASSPPLKQSGSSNNAQSTSAAPDKNPVEVGSLIDKATQKVAPNYPPTAKSARVAGEVKVFIEVNEKGDVTKVQSTTGPVLLRQAAVDAARRWKFRPTLMDGQPVRVLGFINFNFTL